MPARNRDHYRGSYDARARAVRATALANPGTPCWRCGLTWAAYAAIHGEAAATWVAGHTVDGDSTAPLAPEHTRCNAKAGQALTMAKREPHSQAW
jgi:hypothetical protein